MEALLQCHRFSGICETHRRGIAYPPLLTVIPSPIVIESCVGIAMIALGMLHCTLAFQDSDEDSFSDEDLATEEEQSIGEFDAEFIRMMGGSNTCTTSDNPTKSVSSRMQDKMDSERKVRPSSM